MAPIKFEDNIREKLQNREIEPSGDAWNKLDTALGKPPKRKSTTRTWLAIAASLLVLFFVGRTLIQGNQVEQQIAEETIEEVEQQPLADPSVNEIIAEDQPELAAEIQVDNESVKSTVEPKVSPVIVQPEEVNVTPSEAIAIIEEPKEEIIQIEEQTDPTEDSFMTDKVDEVVAQVQALQAANSSVSAEEVEALLDAAQREISNQKLLIEGAKVDPMALLMDVESEMERSFRDKVFDALGDGFDKVRTAVAERNN